MAFTQEQIGAWLAEARRKADLSQSAAGRAILKDAGQISKWERAEREMAATSFLELIQVYGGRDVIRRLSLMLGVEPTYLGLQVFPEAGATENVTRPRRVAEADAPYAAVKPRGGAKGRGRPRRTG